MSVNHPFHAVKHQESALRERGILVRPKKDTIEGAPVEFCVGFTHECLNIRVRNLRSCVLIRILAYISYDR